MNATDAKDANVMLPSEHERRQIFYWLKQVSSHTAWNRVLDFYKAWADAAEESVRQANALELVDKSRIPESDYVLILKGLAHCEEGVLRLRKGDKRVFKFDANGEFAMANRPLSHFSHYLTRLEWGEHPPVDPKTTPNWSDFKTTLVRAAEVWSECALVVLETRHYDDPATNVYGAWLVSQLAKMRFPSILADVPSPVDNVLVTTGKMIPHSGIWEPVDAPKPKGFRLFGGAESAEGPFPIAGCMNYLHGGAAAPKVLQAFVGEGGFEEATTWRLLWRDDRYEDGSIPPEEQNYVFLQPEPEVDKAPAPTAAPRSKGFLWGESGQPALKPGRWLLQDDLTVSVELQSGEPLPLHEGNRAQWVLADRQ